MARPAKFARADLVGAATELAASLGPGAVTMASVAERVGAPTGSIYHRFDSREALMAEVWLAAVEALQAGMLSALQQPSEPPGLLAALFPVQWARADPAAARLVVLYRRQDFVRGPLPEAARSRAEQLAAGLDAALAAFAQETLGAGDLSAKQHAAFLLIDMPHAALRRYLAAGIDPPATVDEIVREAFVALARRQPGPD